MEGSGDENDFAVDDGHVAAIALIVNNTSNMEVDWTMIMGFLLATCEDAAAKGRINRLIKQNLIYEAVQLTLTKWIATVGGQTWFNSLLRTIQFVNQGLRDTLNAMRESIRSRGESFIRDGQVPLAVQEVGPAQHSDLEHESTQSNETQHLLSVDDGSRNQPTGTNPSSVTYLDETQRYPTVPISTNCHDLRDLLPNEHIENETPNQDVHVEKERMEEDKKKFIFKRGNAWRNAFIFLVVISFIITCVAIICILSSRSSHADQLVAEDSGPAEPVTVNHTFFESRGSNRISNLVYMMSANDPSVIWFSDSDRTSLRKLTIRGNFTMSQISFQVLGTNIQYCLEALAFRGPHICKEFAFDSAEICPGTIEFKKLKTIEFLDIGSECTELFDFFSDCVRFPKDCIIRVAYSGRQKLNRRSEIKLKEETGCEVWVNEILL